MTRAALTIEERLQAVEAVQAIQALKARYAALADMKYTPQHQRQPAQRLQELGRLQAECFTEDATWDGGGDFGGTLAGRAQLADWFSRSPWCFALHFYTSPELSVQGRQAHGRWRLWQVARREDNREAVLLAAVTSGSYACTEDGRWLHSRMSFEQIHILPVGVDPLLSQLGVAVAPSPLRP